jgi:hypothetical protein
MISTEENPDSSTTALWQSYQHRQLVANQEYVGKENNGLCLRTISFILRKVLHRAVYSFNIGSTALLPSEGRRAADFYHP